MGRRGRKPVVLAVPQKLMDRYAAGETTLTAIARRVGRSVSWVWTQLRRAGVTMHRRGRGTRAASLEIPARVRRQYEAGEVTVRDVARLVGVSAKAVVRELQRAGVDTSRRAARRRWAARQHPDLELTAQVLQRYDAGEIGIVGLARRLGVSTEVVTRELQRAGLDTSRRAGQLRVAARRRGQSLPPPTVLVALYRQGLTLRQLGVRFGVTRERIRQILVAQGHVRRGQGVRPAPQG